MKPKTSNNPTAIRLGEYKAGLQKSAMEQDRSLNWLIKKLAKEYLEGQKPAIKERSY